MTGRILFLSLERIHPYEDTFERFRPPPLLRAIDPVPYPHSNTSCNTYGFEGALQYQEADRCIARVLSVDDSAIIDTGLVRSGEQRCELEFLSGLFRGRTAYGVNMLNGSLEQDKIFAPGDRALVVVSYQGDEILSVTMIDHYRISKEVLLAGIFAVFLIVFAGRTGVRAIASFAMTILMLWKVLVPLYLKGFHPFSPVSP